MRDKGEMKFKVRVETGKELAPDLMIEFLSTLPWRNSESS